MQITIEAEKPVTTEAWYNSGEGLENLKSDFEAKANSKLFSIDVEKNLTASEWEDILPGLEKDGVDDGSDVQ